MGREGFESQEEMESGVADKLQEPPMYRVLLHNDDYTSMDFVVEVLMFVFNKTPEDATVIMLDVHKQGIGTCGIFTRDVAETKVETVHNLAREREFPLKSSMEKV